MNDDELFIEIEYNGPVSEALTLLSTLAITDEAKNALDVIEEALEDLTDFVTILERKLAIAEGREPPARPFEEFLAELDAEEKDHE